MKKRSLALLLAGAMIVSTVPMSVFADETEASTSEDVLHVTDDVGGRMGREAPGGESIAHQSQRLHDPVRIW